MDDYYYLLEYKSRMRPMGRAHWPPGMSRNMLRSKKSSMGRFVGGLMVGALLGSARASMQD